MNRQITRFKGLGSITTGRPDYGWSPPDGQVVYTQGMRWGIYKDSMKDGMAVTVWSGSSQPAASDDIAMQFIAACAYEISDRDRFHGQAGAMNDVAWGMAA